VDIRVQPERITETHAYFWNSLYSQWYTTSNQFQENGIDYPNAEKYMMVKKANVFKDYKILNEMVKSDNPRLIKKLGRKIKNFDDKTWDKYKIDIVTQASYLKFTQNPELLKIMIEHKDLTLVEASPEDKIWGIGLHFSNDNVLDETKWQGENLLGKCLMKARDRIIKEQGL